MTPIGSAGGSGQEFKANHADEVRLESNRNREDTKNRKEDMTL